MYPNAIHAVLTLFLLFWKPDQNFVCEMMCIKENTVMNAQGHSLVFIEYYGYLGKER